MIPVTPEDLLRDYSLHILSSWMKEDGTVVGMHPQLLLKVKGIYSTLFPSIWHLSNGLWSIFDQPRFLLTRKKNSQKYCIGLEKRFGIVRVCASTQ